MVELAALKFAVLALYEALENAERVKKGIKYYPDNVVAIRPTFLDVDKITKSTILKIAKKHGIASYRAINLTKNKTEKAIVINLEKLNQALHVNLEEMESSARSGVDARGSATPTKHGSEVTLHE